MEQRPAPANPKIATIKIACIAAALVLMAIITIQVLPLMRMVSQPNGQQQFQLWIDSLGFWGWFVLLGIQMMQIIVAFIPGEPVEIVSGMLYGAVGGFLTCELGILLGSVAIFYAVRAFGRPLITAFIPEEKLASYSFLHNAKKLERLTFILFFLPGTPKDVLTYVAGLTPISPFKFLAIATFARVPTVFSSTWAGSTMMEGNWEMTVLIFLVIGGISLLGIWAHNRLMARAGRGNPREGEAQQP